MSESSLPGLISRSARSEYKREGPAHLQLNLRNDQLRRKFDSLKYDLKRCEDVVYDLTLRGLTPAPATNGVVPQKRASPSKDEDDGKRPIPK